MKKSNVNIKIPDIISNTSSSQRLNNYQRLNAQDDSDSDSKKSRPISTGNNHSIQMQHEVILKLKFSNILKKNYNFLYKGYI